MPLPHVTGMLFILLGAWSGFLSAFAGARPAMDSPELTSQIFSCSAGL